MTLDWLLVTISLLLWGIGEGAYFPYQGVYLQNIWHATPIMIGIIFGINGLMMAVTLVPVGMLSDRLGPRPFMRLTWIMGVMATWVMALATNLPVFVSGIFLYGLTGAVLPPMNSYLAARRGSLSMERALTLPGAIFQAGYVIGALLGGVMGDRIGLHTVYIGAALVFIPSTLVMFFIKPVKIEHAILEEVNNKTRSVLTARQIGLLSIIFITMLTLWLPQPLTPNYLQNIRHISYTQLGQLNAIGSIGNTIILILLGNLNAVYGIIIGQVLTLGYAIILWKSNSFNWYILAYLSLGGYRLTRLMVLAYFKKAFSSIRIGFAFGLLETLNAATMMIAPPLAGLLYTWQPDLVYIFSAVLIGLMILVNLFILPGFQKKSEPDGMVVQEV